MLISVQTVRSYDILLSSTSRVLSSVHLLDVNSQQRLEDDMRIQLQHDTRVMQEVFTETSRVICMIPLLAQLTGWGQGSCT